MGREIVRLRLPAAADLTWAENYSWLTVANDS